MSGKNSVEGKINVLCLEKRALYNTNLISQSMSFKLFLRQLMGKRKWKNDRIGQWWSNIVTNYLYLGYESKPIYIKINEWLPKVHCMCCILLGNARNDYIFMKYRHRCNSKHQVKAPGWPYRLIHHGARAHVAYLEMWLPTLNIWFSVIHTLH